MYMLMCRRVGPGQADGPLGSVSAPGWAASVTMAKCDVACAEDAAQGLGQHRSWGTRESTAPP